MPSSEPEELDLLKRLAAKYIWWKHPDEAVQYPQRVMAQVMTIGEYQDIQQLVKLAGNERLKEVLRQAEIGQFSEQAWAYWHYRLGLAAFDSVPPLPSERFPAPR
jgi:hypothetical protein